MPSKMKIMVSNVVGDCQKEVKIWDVTVETLVKSKELNKLRLRGVL